MAQRFDHDVMHFVLFRRRHDGGLQYFIEGERWQGRIPKTLTVNLTLTLNPTLTLGPSISSN